MQDENNQAPAKRKLTRKVKPKDSTVEIQTASEPEPIQTSQVGDNSNSTHVEKISFPHVVLGGYTSRQGVIEVFGMTQDDSSLTASVTDFSLDSGIKIKFANDGGSETNVELAYGVTAIFGVSNSGKSELSKYLAYQLNVPVFRFSEPEIPSVMEPHILISEIEKFLQSEEQVMIIDSFRFFIYNTAQKSAAGKGGVNTKLYSDLTALSVTAAFRRKSIIVVLNPMSDDDSSEIVFKALEGSISGLFKAKDYGNCQYASRVSSSMRNFVSLAYSAGISEPNSKMEQMEWLHGSHSQTDQFAQRVFARVVSQYNNNN